MASVPFPLHKNDFPRLSSHFYLNKIWWIQGPTMIKSNLARTSSGWTMKWKRWVQVMWSMLHLVPNHIWQTFRWKRLLLGWRRQGNRSFGWSGQVHGSHQLDGRKGSGKEGLVVRDWVDQRGILAHPVTHCGWNSVSEGLSTDGSRARIERSVYGKGAKSRAHSPSRTWCKHNVTCDAVKELKRKKARERAQEFGRKARQAVEKGGSSDEKLDQLIQRLVLRQENSRTS